MKGRLKRSKLNGFTSNRVNTGERRQYADDFREPLGITHISVADPLSVRQLHKKLEGTIGVPDVDKLRKELCGDSPRVEVEVRLDPTKIKAKKR